MLVADSGYTQVRLHGLGDVLCEQSRSRPGHLAVIDGTVRLTYRDLDLRVDQLAQVLRDRGAGPGSRILWVGQNSHRLLEAILAGARLGAVTCPVNWRMSPEEAAFALQDFDPAIVLWEDGEVGPLSRKMLQSTAAANRAWIRHDGDGSVDYEALLQAAKAIRVDESVNPDSAVLAIYTAAFGGRPNAALLSHTTLLLQGWLSQQGQQIDEGSAYLASGPMFHLGVLMGVLATFLAGGRIAFVARVQPEELLQLIDRERVTHGYVPLPTVEQMRVINSDGRYDVSSLFAKSDMSDWRMPLVMPASAPMSRAMGCYGQTEISGLAILAWLGGSGAGRPAPFVQVRIVDAAGNECAPDETGEIVVRGPLVMCGYYNRDEENARRVAQGWHHTHDLGLRRPDGSLVFVGPKTTMIKSGVENIYPAEVEACLRTHPAVLDVCVIGVPDPTWQQNVKAIVVPRPGHAPGADELIQHCRDRIASYKKPKLLTFVDALPRGAAGTIDREAVDAAHGGGGYPAVG